MTIDLSQFHQVFFEESFEGLDIMEAALMELDPANLDEETINAIFRAAHSIKGGSATFGFTAVSDFTHDLETILDQVRSGRRDFTASDVDVCLKSVDCMREMLQRLKAGEQGRTPLSEELKQRFSSMLNNTVEPQKNVSAAPVVSAETAAVHCWTIRFAPNADLLKSGNDVVRMVRELADLGSLVDVQCQTQLPGFSSMDPELCYLSWDIVFEGAVKQEHLEDVFEWVADDADIQITPLQSEKSWKIQFIPGADILRSGNEPARLFAALADFGRITVNANTQTIPMLASLDSEQCYLRWDITLLSDTVSQTDIREVFEWVLDDSQLIINGVSQNTVEPPGAEAKPAKRAPVEVVTPVRESITAEVVAKALPVEEQKPLEPAVKPATAKKNLGETGSIRVGIDKVDNLINMVGELVITQSMLGQLGTDFDMERVPKLLEGLSQLEQNTRELQESVMRIRMLPISFAFSRFPRMVRDLGQSLGKKLHLEMLGEQTELDKTVMEKIGDPLVHLVRNAVDHGIETPAERRAVGKPETGTITLNAYHQGGNVVIEIADDGKGLDREKLLAKAVERGLVAEHDAEYMSAEQAYDLIFQPGFSTAVTVSDVSGRGVGMDVVKRNIQALNGSVEIESKKNVGSTITIRLPLTLAILDGQLVRVGSNTYIFPLVSIVESLQCQRDFISRVAGGCDVFKLRDDYVPIIELYKTFSITPDTTDLDQSLMVVVESDGEKIGIVVDELLAQQQVVIKSLEQNYKRVDGISGATILGDGTVALILDIGGIVKLAGEKFNIAHQATMSRNSEIQYLAGERFAS